MTAARSRASGVDALRALALLAVVIVNVAGYRALVSGGPLPALAPSDGPLALGLSFLVATLLQGKGVSLLTLLLGYSLALGRAWLAASRLRRLLVLGLLHGFLLYSGDILTLYALCGFLALRHRRARLRRLWRRALVWLSLSVLLLTGLLVLSVGLSAGLPVAAEEPVVRLMDQPWPLPWLGENAAAYAWNLLYTPAMLPLSYGLVLAGLVAGRLRLLQHRRWRSLWRRAARWALPLLALNVVYGLAYAQALRSGSDDSLVSGIGLLLGPLSLLGLVPWLLLRPLPQALQRAGRNTLSIYIGSSLLSVGLWAVLKLQLGVAGAYLLALGCWMLLMALAARFERLPLEAWMARRRPV